MIAKFYRLVNPELIPQNYSRKLPRFLEQLLLYLRLNSLSMCPMSHYNMCSYCEDTPFSTAHYLIECPATCDEIKRHFSVNLPIDPTEERIMEEAANIMKKLSKNPAMLHQIGKNYPPIVVCHSHGCAFQDIPYNTYPEVWAYRDFNHFAGAS